jgi:hypothetical protein
MWFLAVCVTGTQSTIGENIPSANVIILKIFIVIILFNILFLNIKYKMFEILKLSLLNWQIHGIYLPPDCAYIIGNQIIEEKYKRFFFLNKFEIIKDKLFLSISPKVLPRHRVIRNCIKKWYYGPYYGQQQYIQRLYNNKYNEYGVKIFIDFHNKVRDTLGLNILLNWQTLTNDKDLETVRNIILSLGDNS